MNQTTTERGAVMLTHPNGEKWTTEREIVRVDDWQATPWGPANFGSVWLGPQRIVQVKEPQT